MSTKATNTSGLRLKNVGISIDTQVIRKPLPKDKRKWPGLKKGSGQLPEGGAGMSGQAGGMPAAEGLEFVASLLNLNEAAPPIEDITDEQGVETAPRDPNAAVPTDAPMGEVGDDGTSRYVKGAHLIFKRQVDTASFDELWIYSIDPEAPEQAGQILKAILAGTDIQDNKTRSDDGSQSYSLWTAGNAQYVHITGLSN